MKKFLVSLLLVCAVLSLASVAGAPLLDPEMDRQLGAAAGPQGAGLGVPIPPTLIAVLIIRVVLSFIAIILICLNVYAGYLWMTAGGNSEQVEQAKTTLRNGIIGLVLILAAYSITIFAANLARGYYGGHSGGFFPFLF